MSFQSILLLLMFQLWLLLLRRETYGGKGTPDEAQTTTDGAASPAYCPAGALLRTFRFLAQQPPLAREAGTNDKRHRFHNWHRQRITYLNAWTQYISAHFTVHCHDVHIRSTRSFCTLQTGRLAYHRWSVFLLHVSVDNRVRRHGSWPTERVHFNHVVLLGIYNVRHGVNRHVLQRVARGNHASAQARC